MLFSPTPSKLRRPTWGCWRTCWRRWERLVTRCIVGHVVCQCNPEALSGRAFIWLDSEGEDGRHEAKSCIINFYSCVWYSCTTSILFLRYELWVLLKDCDRLRCAGTYCLIHTLQALHWNILWWERLSENQGDAGRRSSISKRVQPANNARYKY